ncbi:MAG: 16S rRNA (guanine(966)-N(2))-methyltransferase RsmD [Actinomycetota bacterium]
MAGFWFLCHSRLHIVRVIAGVAKGRRLKSPPARVVRPTTDRVKEALFSALGLRVPKARVLDLYAGSGQLGIEALSRGAASATFVERDAGALSTIRENLAGTGFASRGTVVAGTVERFLEGIQWAQPFDLVLIDPPFAVGLPTHVLASLATGDRLGEDALVVVEVSRAVLPLDPPDGFRMTSERRYGDCVLLFLRPERSARHEGHPIVQPAGDGDRL